MGKRREEGLGDEIKEERESIRRLERRRIRIWERGGERKG